MSTFLMRNNFRYTYFENRHCFTVLPIEHLFGLSEDSWILISVSTFTCYNILFPLKYMKTTWPHTVMYLLGKEVLYRIAQVSWELPGVFGLHFE